MSSEITPEALNLFFVETIKMIKEDADVDETRSEFLRIPPFEISAVLSDAQFHITSVFVFSKIYERLCFFPDDEVIQHFRRFGYSEKHLCWFIDVNLMAEEMRRIHSSGVLEIQDATVFVNMIVYVQWMAGYTILNESGYDVKYAGRGKTSLENFRIKYLRNKYHDHIDTMIVQCLASKLPNSDESLFGFAKDFFRGQLEKRLLLDVFDGFKKVDPKLSERTYLIELYPLFRLLLRDECLPETDDEWEERRYELGYDDFNEFKIGRVRLIWEKRTNK